MPYILQFHVYFHEQEWDYFKCPKRMSSKQSRPVVMLKLNIIVTLSMMEAIFVTLHKKNTIVIKINKWRIVLVGGLFVRTLTPKYDIALNERTTFCWHTDSEKKFEVCHTPLCGEYVKYATVPHNLYLIIKYLLQIPHLLKMIIWLQTQLLSLAID